MRSFIRLIFLGITVLVLGHLRAQGPYIVYVYGQLDGISGQPVTVQTMPGTLPAQTVTAADTMDGYFVAAFAMDSYTGGFLAFSICEDGTTTADSSAYTLSTPLDTAFIELHLTCSGDTSTPCQACFTVTQTAPFTADFTNCSSGGTPPYTNVWLLPNGATSLDQQPALTFDGTSANDICLQSTDAMGCTNVSCQTVFVGADGTINPTDPIPCLANFEIGQAYSDTSNGGSSETPIPNQVWVLDFSNAIDGIDTYLWDFGDGTTSTQMYSTHLYAGPGPYQLCLTISNGSCSDIYCDSISMDEAGLLNGMATDPGTHTTTHASGRSGGFMLSVIESFPAGVAKLPAMADFKLWPNPAQEELNMSFNSVRAGAIPVTVISTDGRVVLRDAFNMVFGGNTLRLNTQGLDQGLYMMRIGDDANSATHRFLKVR